MRLMLGTPGNPSLLVTVDDNFDPSNFKFTVINGAWDGVFTNGHITVLGCPGGSFSDLGITHILTDDQNRLRCDFANCDFTNSGSYNEVFANFHNPNYIAPEYKKADFPSHWDDDIPF